MSKATDAVIAAIKANFETGDVPDGPDFAEFIQQLQDSVQEHEHKSTGGAGSGTGDATLIDKLGTLVADIDMGEHSINNLLLLTFKDAIELTISGGSITATQAYHTVDTEADAATDDLDTIAGGMAGEILYLRAANGARTVVLKHMTGNIITPEGIDYPLNKANKVVELLSDGTNWRIIGMGAHGATHRYMGADELSGMWTTLASQLHTDSFCETADPWTMGTTGTGAASIIILKLSLATDATQNSKAYAYLPQTYPARGFHFWYTSIRTDPTNCEMRFWVTKGSLASPVDTEHHVGFKIIDGNIFATNANGATETATDTGVDVSQYATYRLVVMVDAGVSAKFYVNGVLKATHTTNLPDVWDHYILHHIINDGAAANKAVWVRGYTFEDYVYY